MRENAIALPSGDHKKYWTKQAPSTMDTGALPSAFDDQRGDSSPRVGIGQEDDSGPVPGPGRTPITAVSRGDGRALHPSADDVRLAVQDIGDQAVSGARTAGARGGAGCRRAGARRRGMETRSATAPTRRRDLGPGPSRRSRTSGSTSGISQAGRRGVRDDPRGRSERCSGSPGGALVGEQSDSWRSNSSGAVMPAALPPGSGARASASTAIRIALGRPVQPRAHGPGWDPERVGRPRRATAEVVVQHEHGPLTGVESAKPRSS